MKRARGFTLVELAVVMAIIGLLLGSMMMTFSARVDQQNRTDTQRLLDEAKDLVLSFGIVNGRLPCPAISTSSGAESYTGNFVCDTTHGGFLPARAIGFQPTDSSGFAIDAWGNRIRYAVSASAGNTDSGTTCGSPASPPYTYAINVKANGITCAPQDIVICAAASGTSEATGSCGTATQVTNQKTVVAVIFSTGKNGAFTSTSADELANTDGGTSGKGVYVYRTPSDNYDDMMVWIPIGVLYGRLIAAGVLP